MPTARETRVPIQLPVRVWGMDSDGKVFNVHAYTVDITPVGARLQGEFGPLRRGAVIGIECGRSKARFQVSWVGDPSGPRHGQIGIRCVEPGKYIWGVALKRTMDEASLANMPLAER